MLTTQQIREIWDYDNNTGNLIWKIKPAKQISIGSIAGCKNTKGYVVIRYSGTLYYAHRIIWQYVHGYSPKYEIDHIDGNTGNNVINNLRDVEHTKNGQNIKRMSNNTSGITGVDYNAKRKMWRARIWSNGKNINLGWHKDKNAAMNARKLAEIQYQPLRTVLN